MEQKHLLYGDDYVWDSPSKGPNHIPHMVWKKLYIVFVFKWD